MKTFVLALCAVLVVLAGPAHAERSMLFVADVDFAPYSMIVEGQPAGIDVEVMAEACKRAGFDLDIQFKPWDDLVRMVEKGECDGAFALFRSPEREKKVIYMESAPVHYSDYVLFTKVGTKFRFRTYEDLRGKTVGKVSGTDLGDEFAQAVSAGIVTVKEYPDLSSSVRGLLVGEVDAYAGNMDVTYYRLKDMGMSSSIVYLPKKLVEQKPAYLVLSRATKREDKERIMLGLSQALEVMRRDGTYKRIARRYLLRF